MLTSEPLQKARSWLVTALASDGAPLQRDDVGLAASTLCKSMHGNCPRSSSLTGRSA